MALPQKAKQSSILDFFKNKNGASQSAPTVAKESAAIVENNNKRPLESDEIEPVKIIEPSVVDVNFISDGILDICLDCNNDEEVIEEEEDNKENNSPSKSQPSSNYTFQTFRTIIRTILGDEHYSYLFHENDWAVIQEFTCLPGMPELVYYQQTMLIMFCFH